MHAGLPSNKRVARRWSQSGENPPWRMRCATGSLGYARKRFPGVWKRPAKSGGRVLYVANTVARATAAFDRLGPEWGPRARLYHSRFKYEDRVRIQGEVLELFRSPGPAFVAATQVCEMSLDISATLLISELAPFPSLVQRLGRLNRRCREPDKACPALIVEPPDSQPYDKEALLRAAEELEPLDDQELSQRNLADVLAGMQDGSYAERLMPLAQPG